MKTLKFKTNVNCNNCIAKITPYMDGNLEIKAWKVDTDNPEKILTVEGEEITTESVIETLSKAGYTAEEIQE